MFKGFGKNRNRGKHCQGRPVQDNSGTDNQQPQVLTRMDKGCKCRVRRHNAGGPVRQRLLDLGFIPDTEVEMIRSATLGDPLEMRLGTYYVTLRKKEADLIEVEQQTA
ncbi:MAG: ferrous iron transport protein A [Desulfonatronovibrio sp.]